MFRFKENIMSRVHELIKNRHTTRLMTDAIKPEDVQTIMESARRAPSKNKIYGYKVIALSKAKALLAKGTVHCVKPL